MSPKTNKQNEQIREQSRRQITDAAFELFAREGYSRTSMAAVAKKAKVSKGLIYHYFESKEAILHSIFDDLMQKGDQIMYAKPEAAPREQLKSIIEQTFTFIRDHSGIGKLMIGLALQHEAYATLKNKIDLANQEQVRFLAALMAKAGFDTPELFAYKLAATLDGMMMATVTMGEDYPLDEIKNLLVKEYVPDTNP